MKRRQPVPDAGRRRIPNEQCPLAPLRDVPRPPEQEADCHEHESRHNNPTRGPVRRAAGGSRIASGGLRRLQLSRGGRRRLTGQLRFGQRGRLLGLHALARRTRIPRPRQRRKPSKRYRAGLRGQQLAIPGSRAGLSAPATQQRYEVHCLADTMPDDRRLSTRRGAAGAHRRSELRPCMRNHGVPNWPDPTVDSTGRPSFQVTAAGISIASTRSPRMLSKLGHCQNQPGAVLLRQE